MPTVGRHAAALVLLIGLTAAADGRPLPEAPQEPEQTRIRVAVDVVAIDVQVIDRTGKPVPDLGPEHFTVTINGRRRRVVSAEQIRSDTLDGLEELAAPASGAIPGRLIMLAVDCISFDATASRDVIQSIRRFVEDLLPDDYVGLSAYPNGPQIAPTRDHAAVLRALNTVVGQRDSPGLSQFQIRPSEIIDISRDISMGSGPTLQSVVARECGLDPEPTCEFRLRTEVTNTALYYEGQATASLGMLRTLVTQMRDYPGRKTLLLVSGGLIASDRPGGRPDLGSLGMLVGREAAAANTAIYTLFVDSTLHDQFAAETRTGFRVATNRARDTAVMALWLEQFTGSAGGALFTVQVGSAERALERIRTELSSYYLLGVEPADEDRDGRTHEVAVRLRQSGLTIRGRRWVMIPKRGVASAAPAPVPAAPDVPPAAETAPRRPVPSEVAALAQTFDRGHPDAFQTALANTRNLAPVIRGFRLSDSPWPDDPRRAAIFALELAFAALRSDARDAREEGGRLLAEYSVRVREPAGADAFECWWLVTQAAALTGLFRPEDALLFVPRAVERCPTAGRIHLTLAVLLEQQWLRGAAAPAQEVEIVSRFQQAMTFPEVQAEARLRAARFLLATGQPQEALAAIAHVSAPSQDREIRYLAELVHGQILRANGRTAEAAARFRAALEEWPGAPSAHVALMTLLLQQGERAEAAALAEAVQTAPPDQYDPWWMYWLGDYRIYPGILRTLHELGR
jgi:VWFA-related protein